MLQIELVKEKFSGESAVLDELLERPEVKSYIEDLNQRLQLTGNGSLRPTHMAIAHVAQPATLLTAPGGGAAARRASVLKRHSMAQQAIREEAGEEPAAEEEVLAIAEATPGFVEEALDPENDIAQINKLLEMLKKDEEFDKEEKEHAVVLGNVETEIKQQEEILEQLKHNIKQYQVLLDENDLLVRELQSLETEKQQLVTQLTHHEKRGSKDAPNTAYVSKLKEQLKSVESRLKTQAVEQKKREDAMSLIKRDSTRCRELEASITNLKKAKVEVVKKQKDAAAHFKAFMDHKNKELAESRRGRQRDKLETSKLESENRKLVAMMSRKTKAHQKTEEALQKNKAHLVKLLAMRKRERQRQSISGSGSKRGGASSSKMAPVAEEEEAAAWAPEEGEDVQSAKFCLVQLISGRVEKQQRADQEHKLVGEYDALQAQVSAEVAALAKLKEGPSHGGTHTSFVQT